MLTNQQKLIFALNNDEEIVSIDNVESGLSCNCICPACGEPLVAKKGKNMMHHFAHYSGHSCEYGHETSLHLTAKDILSKADKMIVPDLYLKIPESDKPPQLIFKSKEIKVDKVELEKKEGSIVPDIVVYSGKNKLFIEIFVTHKIDGEKLIRIKEENVSTIEIDLSKLDKDVDYETLKEILIKSNKEKKWAYSVLAENHLENFVNASKSLELRGGNDEYYVNNCPLKGNRLFNKGSLVSLYDCRECDYCLSFDISKMQLLCVGDERVSTIEDFKLTKEERIKKSEEIRRKYIKESVMYGHCPNCGSHLIKIRGKNGLFWACPAYPDCRFTQKA